VREALPGATFPKMNRRVAIDQTHRARTLRSNATRHELALWHLISRLRPKFTRQLPIGPYIADFACRQARLVIELDGSQHVECARDVRRDAFLSQEGWTVLRIWNAELDANPEGVFRAITERAAECLGGTHPPAPPFQGGENSSPAVIMQHLPHRAQRQPCRTAFSANPVVAAFDPLQTLANRRIVRKWQRTGHRRLSGLLFSQLCCSRAPLWAFLLH